MMAPAPAPDMIEFHGSSFCLMYPKEHSSDEKQRHQAANCPPRTGPFSRNLTKPPMALLLNPVGACRAPPIKPKSPPPMQPIVKAPPQSPTIRHGLERNKDPTFLFQNQCLESITMVLCCIDP